MEKLIWNMSLMKSKVIYISSMPDDKAIKQ